MKSLLWVGRGDDEVVEHADWVEISTLFRADHNVSREDLARALIQAQKIRDIDARGAAEDAFKELEDRIISCGSQNAGARSRYPFALNDDSTVLEYTGLGKQGAGLLYLFLLTITRADMTSGQRRAVGLDPTELFEKLSADVLVEFWGGESEWSRAIVFGTAQEKEANRIDTKFPRNINRLCQELGEGIGWKPTARSPKAGDGGLDLVVYRRFADRRKGGLVGFGQCKTGIHWRKHLGKLKPKSFCGKYFTESLIIEPQEMYFVPCRITPERWDDDSRDGGLLMDRCRIVQFGIEIDAKTLAGCKRWMSAIHDKQKKLKYPIKRRR
jgi:hypothetical protein